MKGGEDDPHLPLSSVQAEDQPALLHVLLVPQPRFCGINNNIIMISVYLQRLPAAFTCVHLCRSLQVRMQKVQLIFLQGLTVDTILPLLVDPADGGTDASVNHLQPPCDL